MLAGAAADRAVDSLETEIFFLVDPALTTVLASDDTRDVLVREGEHLWQQIVLVEVFQVVNLVQALDVLIVHVLYLV